MVPFYKYPSGEESGNEKNCYPIIPSTISANAVTMESIEKNSIKCFKIIVQNKTAETEISPH